MKRVLFLCVANACRSQMAEAFARALGAGVIEPYSAGSYPAMSIHPATVSAMGDIGIDVRGARPKGLQALSEGPFDLAISLCEDSCPTAMAKEHRHWDVANPDIMNPKQFRQARDDIRQRVQALIAELSTLNSQR